MCAYVLWRAEREKKGERDTPTPHSIDCLSLDRPHEGEHTRGGDEREGQEKASGGKRARGDGEGKRKRRGGAKAKRTIHACTECDYRTARKSHLKHMRTHTERNHSHAPYVSTGQLERAVSQSICAPTQETNHSHAPCVSKG